MKVSSMWICKMVLTNKVNFTVPFEICDYVELTIVSFYAICMLEISTDLQGRVQFIGLVNLAYFSFTME